MRKLYCARIFFAALVWALVWSTVAASQSLDEAKVFEWWDSGVINSDEAREILDLIEEGNLQEACMLAEVYALEGCTTESSREKPHRKMS